MVHRKVGYEDAVNKNDVTAIPLISGQVAADRAAMEQMYTAIPIARM